MKKYLGLLVIFGFVFSLGALSANAETEPMPGNGLPKGVRPRDDSKLEVRKEEREKRLETRKEAEEKREAMKTRLETKKEDIQEERDALKEKVEVKREEFKNMTEEEKEAFKEKREEARKALMEKREILKAKAEKLREEAKTKMESLRGKIKDATGLKRYEGRENALHRFDEQVEKVTKLRDRVNGKVVEFEAKGIDVAEAKTHVATADVKLEEAKTKIAEMNSLLGTSATELTKENKTKLNTLAKEAGTLLKDAYQELNMAVKVLKRVTPAVTTTTETSTSGTTTE